FRLARPGSAPAWADCWGATASGEECSSAGRCPAVGCRPDREYLDGHVHWRNEEHGDELHGVRVSTGVWVRLQLRPTVRVRLPVEHNHQRAARDSAEVLLPPWPAD